MSVAKADRNGYPLPIGSGVAVIGFSATDDAVENLSTNEAETAGVTAALFSAGCPVLTCVNSQLLASRRGPRFDDCRFSP